MFSSSLPCASPGVPPAVIGGVVAPVIDSVVVPSVVRCESFGIDTVRLLFPVRLLPEFESHAECFTPQVSEDERKNVRLWKVGESVVYGKCAWYYSDEFYFSLAFLDPKSGGLSLSVKVSVSGHRWGFNAHATSGQDLTETVQKAVERAAKLGMTIRARDAKLCELHLFRDVAMPLDWEQMSPVLREADPPYGSKFVERQGYLLCGSKPNSWAMYDKRSEMADFSRAEENTKKYRQQEKKLELADTYWASRGRGNQTVVRFEWRLQGAQKIRDILKTDSPARIAARYDELSPIFNRALREQVFVGALPDKSCLDRGLPDGTLLGSLGPSKTKKRSYKAKAADLAPKSQKSSKNKPAEDVRQIRKHPDLEDELEGWLSLFERGESVENQTIYEFFAAMSQKYGKPVAQILRLLYPNTEQRTRLKKRLHDFWMNACMSDGAFWGERYAEIWQCVFPPNASFFATEGANPSGQIALPKQKRAPRTNTIRDLTARKNAGAISARAIEGRRWTPSRQRTAKAEFHRFILFSMKTKTEKGATKKSGIVAEDELEKGASLSEGVAEEELVIEITYWSRSENPDGSPVARVWVSRWETRFEILGESHYRRDLLAPDSIGGVTSENPIAYACKLMRKYCGSYFWGETRVVSGRAEASRLIALLNAKKPEQKG